MELRKVVDFHVSCQIKILNLQYFFSYYHPKFKKNEIKKPPNIKTSCPMVPLKKQNKTKGHIFNGENQDKRQTSSSINHFQLPIFLSYCETKLLQEPPLWSPHLVGAAQECSHSSAKTSPFSSSMGPQMPSRRECRVPSLPPGHNFDLSPTASALATSSPPRLLYVPSRVCNFLSPCLCS